MGILEKKLVYFWVVVEGMYTFRTENFGKKLFVLCLFCYREYVDIKDWEFLAIIFWFYICVVVDGIYTCKTGPFVNEPLCLCCILYRVSAHVSLGILEIRFCVYVFVVVKGMYTCKTGNVGKNCLCLYLCC